MNRRSSRGPVLIAGEGQPLGIMTSGNRDPYLCMQGLVKSCSCREIVGSADAHVQSTAMRRPRPQAVRARGASCLPLCFSAKPSPRAPWARGLLSAFWERGSPDLPARVSAFWERGPQTCLPAAHSVAKQQAVRPIFVNKTPKTLAGVQASGGGRCKTSSGVACQVGSRGAEISRRDKPHEPLMT